MVLNLNETQELEGYISNLLSELGWNLVIKKGDHNEILDKKTLMKALKNINEDVEDDVLELAIEEIEKIRSVDKTYENYLIINLLRDGKEIKYIKSDKEYKKYIKYIDFEKIDNNIFEHVRQLKIRCKNGTIIPDIVIFINGIPISFIELKAPEAKDKLIDAYKQSVKYINNSDELSKFNAFTVVSNGFDTKYGSLFSKFTSHWWPWKKINIEGEIVQDIESNLLLDEANYETSALNNWYKNILGLYNFHFFLNIFQNYIHFEIKNGNIYTKIIPTYYQFSCVEKIVKKLKYADENNKQKIGVVWHTQGSGKSVTMVLLAKLIKQKIKKNYQIVYITDRNELDGQLFSRFNESEQYLLTTPVKIESRESLKKHLRDSSNYCIYTTTIQKFCSETGILSNRDNVLIVADEAHRSHNNIDENAKYEIETETLIEKYGFAKFLRDAFPNAKYLGFTGTPRFDEQNTEEIFGNIIDEYTMVQSVKDGSTVPIYYEKRRLPIHINNEKGLSDLDELIKIECSKRTSINYLNKSLQEKIKSKILSYEIIFSKPEYIKKIVSDFWTHYDQRSKALNGKALFVGFSRRVAYLIYDEMKNQRPEYSEKIIFVVTPNNNDDEEMMKYIPTKEQRKEYENEFKQSNSKYKIAVVVDMWLTGFDVPDLDTLYLFKIIKLHNLMQTIARVNRTFTSKDGVVKYDGLIVDYIGIWEFMEEALNVYSSNNEGKKSYNIENLINTVKEINTYIREKYDVTKEMIKNFCDKTNSNLKIDSIKELINIVSNKDSKEKELFFKNVFELSKIYKKTRQILEESIKKESQFYILVRNIIKNSFENENIEMSDLIDFLKKEIVGMLDSGDIEVSKYMINNKKNLVDISEFIEAESKRYNKTKKIDPISFDRLKKSIKNKIDKLDELDPVKSKELLERLKAILSQYDNDEKFDALIKKLRELSIEICKVENDESLSEMPPQLRSFYSIVSNEKYHHQLVSSNKFKKIVLEIDDIIKQNYTDQYEFNSTIKNTINNKIFLLLKKYNYPPEDSTWEATSEIVNTLSESIKKNKEYWANKKYNF